MKRGARRGDLAAISGALRYEFLMQARRWAVWIAIPLFVAWGFVAFRTYVSLATGTVASTALWAAGWSLVAQQFAPIGFGILVADRLARDRRTGVGELLDTLPARPGERLLGKYLGSAAATLVPLLVVYVAGSVYVALDVGAPVAVPLGLLCFVTINLPGLLFVAALSVSVPAVLWVPLYQALFVGYWFWGNALSPDGPIPTISGTILTPIGWYMAAGFFGVRGTNAGNASAWEGAASIALLAVLSALALWCANRYLRWRRDKR